jgi:hypothetical protein
MEIPVDWNWREEEYYKQGENYPFIEKDSSPQNHKKNDPFMGFSTTPLKI